MYSPRIAKDYSGRIAQKQVTINLETMKKLLKKIISGGQTGADRAALDAAIARDMDYGGSIPKGRNAEDGSIDRQYKKLVELDSAMHSVRTERNVMDADATLIFTRGEPSGGTALTVQYALQHKKPFLLVDVRDTGTAGAVRLIEKWLDETSPTVLNVAGPRESKSPGMYKNVYNILTSLLQQ